MNIKRTNYGQTPQGQPVDLFTLVNSSGLEAGVIPFGAILVSLKTPDRTGNLADITLGYSELAGYFSNKPSFGATIGRFGNRIAGGRFTLDGATYRLAKNNGNNHLHGGIIGFHKVLWQAETVQTKASVGVKFSYLSQNGEEGYPGNLLTQVIYSLTEQNELKIEYHAETDQATPINLTHHSYFNLAGESSGNILAHELVLNAETYTPVNNKLIPTGEIHSVIGSPLDFTKPRQIGAEIDKLPGGYDHNLVLKKNGDTLSLAAQVFEATSGRVMELYTTEPGVQFYTGNFLDGTERGKSGQLYQQHFGFCLEAQHFPDSPNQPNFPSTILRPGEKYYQLTVHKFYVRD